MNRHDSRRTLMRVAGVAAAGLLLAVSITSCSATTPGSGAGTTSAAADTLALGKKQGYLRVAIANEPPYTKVNADGSLHGASPDILRAVLKTMGIAEIQGIVTPYDAMIPGLNANRWDVIAAGLFMKQSRCAAVAYSEPVIVSTESFGTPVGNPKGIKTIADVLANPALKIAVLSGGFEEGILKNAKVPSGQQVLVKDSRSGMEAVTANRADAFLLPTLSLKSLVQQDASIAVTAPISDAPRTGSGAAFRKGDTKLLAEYNTHLATFKASQAYTDLMVKYGFDPNAAKGVTAAELCKNPG